jgi:hypothetical protein
MKIILKIFHLISVNEKSAARIKANEFITGPE